jgi:surfeit locus 1 family protein
MIWPLVFGIGGVAILMSLGIWQVQRLAWKEGILADIEARIAAPAEALPDAPIPSRIATCPWKSRSASLAADYVRVLVSQRGQGAQYRVISALSTPGGRRILVDRGVMPTEGGPPEHESGPSPSPATCTGRRRWTASRPMPTWRATSGTPATWTRWPRIWAPNRSCVIARELSVSDAPVTPLPVDTERHSERSPELRDHVVFAGRALDGDDTLSSVAYQAETQLRGAPCATSPPGARPRS